MHVGARGRQRRKVGWCGGGIGSLGARFRGNSPRAAVRHAYESRFSEYAFYYSSISPSCKNIPMRHKPRRIMAAAETILLSQDRAPLNTYSNLFLAIRPLGRMKQSIPSPHTITMHSNTAKIPSCIHQCTPISFSGNFP